VKDPGFLQSSLVAQTDMAMSYTEGETYCVASFGIESTHEFPWMNMAVLNGW
jgi:hypothetical protein